MTTAPRDGFQPGWPGRLMAVLRKELRDHSRDRRSLMLALIYPILAPMLLAGGLGAMAKAMQGVGDAEVVPVPVIGAQYAPGLIDHMQANNLRVVVPDPAEGPPAEQVKTGRLPLVLEIPPAAATADSYKVRLLMNLSRLGNVQVTVRVATVVSDYNRAHARAALADAGIGASAAEPVTVERVNVTEQNNIAAFFYNLMPPLIVFMVFLGGVHLAIDTTVGERERGSLEPLLIAPVERWVLLLGKAITALIFTAVTTVVNLAAFWALFTLVAAGRPEILAPPDVGVFALILLTAVPLMVIAVALQMTIAVVTRSMKEAQIYLGLLPLVPALPGMIMVFAPIQPTGVGMALPVFGQMLMFNQLTSGQALDLGRWLVGSVSTLVVAGLIFLWAVRLFRREKMFFMG